jgi:hypothetical protein
MLAWIMAVILIFTSSFVTLESSIGQTLTTAITGFFLLSAVLISFGNWVERKTRLTLDVSGIEFTNGLRHVIISWMAIGEVRIFPSRIGKKVFVYGANEFFSFQTQGELFVSSKMRDRIGFEKGEVILETILYQSRLSDTIKHQADGFYYYLRE